jgi:hypothetical protein
MSNDTTRPEKKKIVSFDWVDELGKNGGNWEDDLKAMIDAKLREFVPVAEKKKKEESARQKQARHLREKYGDKKKTTTPARKGGE